MLGLDSLNPFKKTLTARGLQGLPETALKGAVADLEHWVFFIWQIHN